MTATDTQTTATTTWKIDPAHSAVEFAVRHMMITTVKGRFTESTGTLDVNEADPTRSKVDFVIQAASIDTREPQRDAHLRSADFFDVEKHPTIRFHSTRIEGSPEDFKMTGDLTIHGVTRPVTLDVTFEGRAKDPWGGERLGYSATGKIKRGDFGLTWNAALETGGFLVGDEVKMTFDIELVKSQATS
jgi:polyisoprenoid-binding protein YceI